MKYGLPDEIFFVHTWCPHYFFEMLSWLGISFVSSSFHSFLTFLIISSFLTGRG